MSHGKPGEVSLRHYPMGPLRLWVSPRGMQGFRPPWCCAKENRAHSFSVAHLPVFAYFPDASGLHLAAMHQGWPGMEVVASQPCFALSWAIDLLSA